MVNLELEKKIKQINSYLAVVDSNQKSIALALGFIELNNLFSPDFVSMNDFTRKTFNFNRRKTWQYLKFCYIESVLYQLVRRSLLNGII